MIRANALNDLRKPNHLIYRYINRYNSQSQKYCIL